MTDDFDLEEPTAEELAEAEALARALDRGSARGPVPEDALGAAGLLRFSRDEGTLDEAKLDTIFADVMKSARPVRPRAEARPWWRWLVPASLVTAAAVAALLSIPLSPEQTTLPSPNVALLRAQAEAATGRGEALDEAMGAYRAQLMSALEARYE